MRFPLNYRTDDYVDWRHFETPRMTDPYWLERKTNHLPTLAWIAVCLITMAAFALAIWANVWQS